MAQQVNFPRDTTLHEIAEVLRNKYQEFDGTAATYNKIMREWFIAQGANEASPAQLTRLCDRWYSITRVPWHGWVSFSKSTAVSTGTRGGDNEHMTCAASTDTVAGKDDYAGNPLFACVDCNFVVDPETLEPQITAISGITDNFQRYSPDHFVGVLQMSGYFGVVDYEDRYEEHYSSTENVPVKGIAPLDEAVRPISNNVRPWVVHGKYFNHTVNNKMTSYAGVIPTAHTISHNTLHTLAAATGTGYSGGTTADDAFLKIMFHIKYASLTADGIIQGCCNNNFQHTAKVSESGVKRVILSEADGAHFEEGMGVLIGESSDNNVRSNAKAYSTTGQAGAVVTKVEKVSISETNYIAVYVDTAATFDTVANTTLISTFHWANGMTDCVLGNDGSPKDNTSGKYPAKIQGIEFMQGAYEVFADVILNLTKDPDGTYWYEPYICRSTANYSTSVTQNYKASGLRCQQPEVSNWCYIKRLGYSKGVFFPIEATGGSSSTYTRDTFYMNSATEGIREWQARGALALGVAGAGLSALAGTNELGLATWDIAAQLSPNGNRGEWAN